MATADLSVMHWFVWRPFETSYVWEVSLGLIKRGISLNIVVPLFMCGVELNCEATERPGRMSSITVGCGRQAPPRVLFRHYWRKVIFYYA